jgi:flagella basal body P-ring formation protein FlgA
LRKREGAGPLHGIDNPRVVVNGAQVQMVYIDGGLQIVTTGAALQDGAVGDFIKLRNVDSGVVISGQIQADGTVLVSGG